MRTVTTPQDKRAAAIKAIERHEISQARACRLVSLRREIGPPDRFLTLLSPKTVRRTSEPDNPDIRVKMREIAEQRRRFGYRRIGVMLAREGITMNHKKLRRIYGEEGLSVKRRRGRKRALGTRAPMLEPSGPSVRWSLDFVSDSFGDGRRFRILAVIDDFTRECLGLVADTSLSGQRVARELDRIIRLYGKPQMIVSERAFVRHWSKDNGERDRVRI
jgi:putative transposase